MLAFAETPNIEKERNARRRNRKKEKECNCRKVLCMFKREKAEWERKTRRRIGLFYEVACRKGMSLLIDFPFSDFCLLVLEADAAFEPPLSF